MKMNFWQESRSIFKNTGLHFRTGVSFMLPIILIGGVAGSLAVIGGKDIAYDSVWKILKDISAIGLKFFVPIMAAYTAYSISDNAGIAPGFIVGLLAQQIGTGYLGALLGGIIVGYATFMLLKVEVHSMLESTWGFFAPVISTLIVSLFIVYVVGPPIGALMEVLTHFLSGLGKNGSAFLGSVMGFLGGIDYGGPFSKTQSTFATAAIDLKTFVPLGICGAIVTVPPLGMCLATFIKPSLYTKSEKQYAKNSWIYALIGGFTEIVIPLAAGDLLRVTIATAVGSTVAGFVAGFFLLELSTPVLGVAQWFFYNKPLIYVLCVALGSISVALTVNMLKGISKRDIAAIEAEEEKQG
jgi:PTS system fructose-specific IIC component